MLLSPKARGARPQVSSCGASRFGRACAKVGGEENLVQSDRTTDDRSKLFHAVRWLRDALAVEVDAVSSAAVLDVSVSVGSDRSAAYLLKSCQHSFLLNLANAV